jgi:hypothetical protein
MTRECQVRICERLGVKFPGPTRRVSRASPVQTAMCNCTRDEGRSSEAGSQVLASNRCKLLSSEKWPIACAMQHGVLLWVKSCCYRSAKAMAGSPQSADIRVGAVG